MRDEEGKGLKLVALHEFLVQQDDRLINELYTHPATCMSVFRQVLQTQPIEFLRKNLISYKLPRKSIGWVCKVVI